MLNTNNNSQLYSNLYYNYYNPNSSSNNTYNRSKRQRIKNSYVDIANEKKDFISFVINKKELEKYRTLSTTAKTKSQSQTRSINSSLVSKNKKKNTKIKEFFPQSLLTNKKSDYEIIKIKEEPYSKSLRSKSIIINNDNVSKQLENFYNKSNVVVKDNNFEMKCNIKSRQNKIDRRKQNFAGSYIIEKKYKSKKITEDSSTFLSTSIKGLVNFFIKKDQNISIIDDKGTKFEKIKQNEKIEEKGNNIIANNFTNKDEKGYNNNENNNNGKIIIDNFIMNNKNNTKKINFEEKKNNDNNESIENNEHKFKN